MGVIVKVDLDKLDAAFAATTKARINSKQHWTFETDGEWAAAIHNAYPALAAELRALRMENIHLRIQLDAGRQLVFVTRLSDGTM